MPLYKRAGLFNPHETHLAHALAGLPLAPFRRRLWAFLLDSFLLILINLPAKIAFQYFLVNKLHSPSKPTRPSFFTSTPRHNSIWK